MYCTAGIKNNRVLRYSQDEDAPSRASKRVAAARPLSPAGAASSGATANGAAADGAAVPEWAAGTVQLEPGVFLVTSKAPGAWLLALWAHHQCNSQTPTAIEQRWTS